MGRRGDTENGISASPCHRVSASLLFLPTAYCLLFFPVACEETESRRGLSVCSRAALQIDQFPRRCPPPAASRKPARECSLHPSPSPLRRHARAAAPAL